MSSTKSHYLVPFKIVFIGILWGVALLSCTEKKKAPSKEIRAEVEKGDTDDFISIFDGESLNGWRGDPAYWRVANGVLIGELTANTPLPNNTFLIWEGGEPDDFELKLEFKIAEAGNSGVNYRSEVLDSIPFALRGYQADIDGKIRYTGQNYEERKRTTLAYRGERARISSQDRADEPGSLLANVQNNCWQSRELLFQLGDSDSLKTEINFEEWNAMHLIVKGNRMRHFVNGVLMSEIQDNDSINRTMAGKLGLQVHVGPPMKVEYRHILFKEL